MRFLYVQIDSIKKEELKKSLQNNKKEKGKRIEKRVFKASMVAEGHRLLSFGEIQPCRRA